MSRFNSEAYDKLFPRHADPAPVPETPVETFRPSQQEKHETPVPEDPVEDEVEDPAPYIPEEQEVTDDDGSNSQPDSE